jgi:S-adenosylmethionine:tRNA ribosyltransferase-isomerase
MAEPSPAPFVADFDYELPEEAIARRPAEPRSSSRLLVDLRLGGGGGPFETTVAHLDELVGPGDVVVVNDTKVLPARLRLQKATGGQVEILLLEPRSAAGAEGGQWWALVRPSRRCPSGTVLHGPDGVEVAVVRSVGAEGLRAVDLLDVEAATRLGEAPLPPYLRGASVPLDRYQTVFARHPGSVAAPTAGLHLDQPLLGRLAERGARLVSLDLAIGLGTFRPVSAERADQHVMHEERYRIPSQTWEAVQGAERVVAVGTTSLRALEAAAASGALEGRTDLYIWGDYAFSVVDVLLTNFHLPRSSLLLLVDAFLHGEGRWRALYRHALELGFRFLSFGDAMLIAGGRLGSRSARP